MTNHNPDEPLKTFLNGKYAQRSDGEAPLYMRHPTIAVSATVDPSMTPQTVSGVPVFGCDTLTGREVKYVLETKDNGTFTETYTYTDTGEIMSDNSTFQAIKPEVVHKVDDESVYSTNTSNADANYGLVLELEKRTVVTDGVYGTPSYHLVSDVAEITGTAGDDVTATISAAPFNGASDKKESVIFTNVNGTSSATAATLTFPALAGYARAEIFNGQGVVYTTDGTAPVVSPLNGQLAGEGGVIELTGSELALFQFVSFDAADNTDLSFEVRNIKG